MRLRKHRMHLDDARPQRHHQGRDRGARGDPRIKLPPQPNSEGEQARVRNREEANERSLAKAELRRKNARQEGAANDELTRRNHQGQETPEKDLPEKRRQGQGVITKELPKGSCQGKGLAKEKPKTYQESKDYGRQREMVDTGPPTHGTCTCPQDNWCVCGAARTTRLKETTTTIGSSNTRETEEILQRESPEMRGIDRTTQRNPRDGGNQGTGQHCQEQNNQVGEDLQTGEHPRG